MKTQKTQDPKIREICVIRDLDERTENQNLYFAWFITNIFGIIKDKAGWNFRQVVAVHNPKSTHAQPATDRTTTAWRYEKEL